MTQQLREVMTPNPTTMQADTTLVEAANTMKTADIGNAIVLDNGQVCGIVTDRDIVVRAIAEGRDPKNTTVGDICSRDLVTLSPNDTVDKAVGMMRDRAVRRLPVVDGGRAVGIVSIGDLAVERDPNSALADISAAPPNS